MVTQYLKLNLIPSGIMPVAYATQYDDSYAQIEVTVYNGVEEYTIPTNAHVWCVGTKKDNTGFIYPCTFSGSKVTVNIGNQMTTKDGMQICGIDIEDVSGNQIGLLNFILAVQKHALEDDVIVSETDLPALALLPSLAAVADEVGPLKARVDQITTLVDGSTTGDAELQDIRVGYDGKTYSNAGNAVRGQANSIVQNLTDYNAYDLFTNVFTFTSGSHNGVTYTWNNGVCTVSGRATSISVNIIKYADTIPSMLVKGGTYHLKYTTTNSAVMLRIIFRDNNNTTLSTLYATGDRDITVPSNATKWTIALYVENGTSLSASVTVSRIELLNTVSNKEIETELAKYKPERGVLPTGTDLNNVVTYGCYILTSGYSYINAPFEQGVSAVLEVVKGSENTKLQRITITDSYQVYLRSSSNGSFQNRKWLMSSYSDGILPSGTDLNTLFTDRVSGLSSTNSYTNAPCPFGVIKVTNIATNTCLQEVYGDGATYYRITYNGSFSGVAWVSGNSRGVLPTNTDLNNVKANGAYFLTSGNTYINTPFSNGMPCVLEVVVATGNSILQRVTSWETAKVYNRVSYIGSFENREWHIGSGNTYNNTFLTQHYDNTYNIESNPTINTDTNNFLASSNDTTDRTGDIMNMLASTGVCHLGTGVFYVSGVELPTYGMLIGSGPSTNVILSGTDTGYAVKLGNYSCVKDLRLTGKASTYTPVSNVGGRHGILFEATGDASSNPTYKYNATVDNVWITDFNGGGITCNNTGISVDQCIEVSNIHIKRCDAGINVAYRSEFHHFNNVNATGCYYGCICNGGNCLFTNCNFSGDTVGVLIDNQFDQSPNNAHGVFSACKIAHSGGNTGIGIKVVGSVTCENFNGISFDYGKIVIENSKGVMFTGCRLGRQTVIEVSDSTAFFTSCVVRDTTSTSVTKTNSNVHFALCYNSDDGSIYNPLNE